MNSCYIIHSQKLNRFYIGVCHEDLDSRLIKHNNHSYGQHRFTAKADDWQLFLNIECSSFTQAIKIEKHIKKMKSKPYIKNLTLHPELIVKLKEL